MGRCRRVCLLILIPCLVLSVTGARGQEERPHSLTASPEGEVRLREALARLQKAAASGGWPRVDDGPALRPGSAGVRVRQLRRRLGERARTDRFDDDLAAAVKLFQRRHGLNPDAVVGRRTLAQLNVPIEQRIAQVEASLRRWSSVPENPGDPHVLVNIPSFELTLVRGGSIVWRTRIVAGKAWSPTPVLSDRIVAVVANPAWNVPERIAVEEYLPELRRDPEALDRHGLRLLRPSGNEEAPREVDPASVDWEEVSASSFPYLLRQDPGPRNALGRLKFVLTNEMAIYLHDTPAKQLFGAAERDFSHGCIRVEKPVELAEALLEDAGPLREALEGGDEKHLPVRPPVPVHILYLTAWVDEEGGLNFRDDVYGFDVPSGDTDPSGAVAPRAGGL
jgi:L,D-transpeptidase YcbB